GSDSHPGENRYGNGNDMKQVVIKKQIGWDMPLHINNHEHRGYCEQHQQDMDIATNVLSHRCRNLTMSPVMNSGMELSADYIYLCFWSASLRSLDPRQILFQVYVACTGDPSAAMAATDRSHNHRFSGAAGIGQRGAVSSELLKFS